MKKKVLVIILLAVLVLSCLALTACHECEFGEWTVKTPATCTQIGQEQRVCECGETEVRDIQTKGHTYGAWTTVKAATCTEDGLELRYCTCGTTESKVITATGHSYKAVVTDPTCNEHGYTTYICKCGNSYKDAYVLPTGHVYTEGSCKYCDEPFTKGLGYRLSIYGGHYVVDKGTCTDTDIVIPSRYNGLPVQEIDYLAFSGCTNLTSITIPSSITKIGWSAFKDCTNLKKVEISDLVAWCNIDFGDTMANPTAYANSLYLNGKKITELAIPESVTRIGAYAFTHCSSFTTISIPSGVTTIGEYAFQSCTNITHVTIPKSVTKIGKGAFSACQSLKHVYFMNQNGWYSSTASYATTGTAVKVNNSETNATYLKSNRDYYWFRNN